MPVVSSGDGDVAYQNYTIAEGASTLSKYSETDGHPVG